MITKLMIDFAIYWIPIVFLLAVLAGAAWGGIGVSAGSPGWGSISGFFGLFLGLGVLAGYVPLRALRFVLEFAGLGGGDLWDLPLGLRSGIILIGAGLGQAVQLGLLAGALALTQWPRRAALRAAVALGLGGVFCRTLADLYLHGAAGVAAGDLANQSLGAGAAAFMLGSLFGSGHKLAGWLSATLVLVLTTWAGQELPLALRPLSGLALLFVADRLLWSWRVGESEGVERLYPLWRAAYEVHRQYLGVRRLLLIWSQISWRERLFRALGSWLFSLSALALAVAMPVLPAAFLWGGGGPDSWRLLAGIAASAFMGGGGLGLAWSAAGWHAKHHPQWAFLAGLDGNSMQAGELWRRRFVTFLCVTLVGLACGLVSAA